MTAPRDPLDRAIRAALEDVVATAPGPWRRARAQ